MALAKMTYRSVSAADSQIMMRWRNDPKVFAMQVTDRPLSVTEHESWFSQRLKVLESLPFIAYEIQREVLGFARVEESHSRVLYVSIIVSPERRGKGYGLLILQEFMNLLQVRFPNHTFEAIIHSQNIPSQKIFLKVGFIEKESDGGTFKSYIYQT